MSIHSPIQHSRLHVPKPGAPRPKAQQVIWLPQPEMDGIRVGMDLDAYDALWALWVPIVNAKGIIGYAVWERYGA